MIKKSLQLTYPNGLHARPSTTLAKTVKPFNAKVVVCTENGKASANDILEVLALCVFPGEVIFEAEGADEEKVMEALEKFINNLNQGTY